MPVRVIGFDALLGEAEKIESIRKKGKRHVMTSGEHLGKFMNAHPHQHQNAQMLGKHCKSCLSGVFHLCDRRKDGTFLHFWKQTKIPINIQAYNIDLKLS